MIYILAALLANLALTSIRSWRFRPPMAWTDRRYLVVLVGGLLSDLVASYGFLMLVRQPPAQIRSYSLIITILALLAAVALIGKFAFLRDGSPAVQRLRGWIAAVMVTVSLYALFGSIAYFSKVIQDTNFASLTYLFIPAVMLTILWVNTAYDAWDFAERRNQLRPRPPENDIKAEMR